MTPKEALNQLSGVAWQYLTDGYVTVNGKRYTIKDLCDINLKALTELEELKRCPTSEEVCKALSEFFQSMPLYADIENVHYSVEHKKFYNNDYVDMLELISDHFYFEDLPPHLITLIGRFYEGLGK